MTDSQHLNRYLASLRSHLRRISLAEREEIIREIKAHVRDAAADSGGSTSAVLVRLGDPAELARLYEDDALITAAGRSWSPVTLLLRALGVATRGFTGLLIFFTATLGYSLGAALMLTAFLKLLLPQHVGAWVWGGHLMACGLIFQPLPGAHELLGWSYVPLANSIGALLLLGTYLLIRYALRTSHRVQNQLDHGQENVPVAFG